MTSYSKPTPEFAIYLLSFLPERPDYDLWIKIISSLNNTFGNSIAESILKTKFQDERPNETFYKLNNSLENITFGTLIYYAKQFGFDLKNNPFQESHYFKNKKYPSKPIQKPRLNFSEPIYRFTEYRHEERAGILEYDGIVTREQAEKLILKEFPDVERERVYRVAINSQILNKNLNPKTKTPYSDFSIFTEKFKNEILTLNELVVNIGSGFPVCPSQLKEDYKGNTYRINENFIHSELIGIDIDNGLSISDCLDIQETQAAIFIYTTPSHTEIKNRFRILFPLPGLISDATIYQTFVKHFIEVYKSDQAAKSVVQGFFGNSNAKIFVIPTGEILQFKNGLLYE